VNNYHVSNQSRHRGTREFEERSLNGISVCPTLAQKKLQAEKSKLRKSQESYSASSRSYWSEYGETSDSSKERHRKPKHSRRKTAWGRKEEHARSISAPLSDEEENFVQETPEVALVATQAYLLTTRPVMGS
jgi:hypothetical protein